jgi:signal transduction histidine kinase
MRVLLIYFFLIFPVLIHSQTIRNSTPGSADIQVLIDRSAELIKDSSAFAFEYADKALKLARKQHLPFQEAQALECSGRALNAQGQKQRAIKQLEEAVDIYKKLKAPSMEAAVWLMISSIHMELKELDRSMELACQAYELSKKASDTSGMSEAKRITGSIYWNKNAYSEAKIAYEQSLELARSGRNYKGQALALTGIALASREQSDFRKAGQACEEAYGIYEHIPDSAGMAAILNLSGSLSYREGKFDMAAAVYEKACALSIALHNSFETARQKMNLGNAYRELKQFDKSEKAYDSAIYYWQKAGDSAQMAYTKLLTGSLNKVQKKYLQAQDSYLDALSLYLSKADSSGVSVSYHYLGQLYSETGNYPRAISLYTAAIEIVRNGSDRKKLLYYLNILGQAYTSAGDLDLAVNSFSEALALAKDLNDQADIAFTSYNLASVKARQDKHGEAATLLNSSLNIYRNLDLSSKVLLVLNEFGNLNELSGDSSKALVYFEESILLAEKLKDLYHLALCSRKAGEICTLHGNYEKALPLLTRSLNLGYVLKNKELMRNALLAQSVYFERTGDVSGALSSYRLYHLYTDSIFLERDADRLASNHINFELQRKDAAIRKVEQQVDMLITENRIRELQSQKQRTLLWFIIILASLVILLLALIYNRYRIRKRSALMLAEKLREIESINLRLQESETGLRMLNASKDKFFSIIAHDLRNPLTGLIGFAEHIIKNESSLNREEMVEISGFINEAAHSLYSLLENLLHWSRLQTGRMSNTPETCVLVELAGESIKLQKANFTAKNIMLNMNIPDTLAVYADRNMLTLVFRNLISNAVKFTMPGGEIDILAVMGDQQVVVTVTDSGVGIPADILSKLFRMDEQVTSMGTSNEEGTGLGLLLCKECVEKNGGKIWVESEVGTGSSFFFSLPMRHE